MALTELSPAGILVRQNVQALRALLEKDPSKDHTKEESQLLDSYQDLQRALIRAQRDCSDRQKQCEMVHDWVDAARNKYLEITEGYATKHELVASLSRQISDPIVPGEASLPDWEEFDAFEHRSGLVSQLSKAARDLDEYFEVAGDPEDFKDRIEHKKNKYEGAKRRAEDCQEHVQRLYQEYQKLTDEVKAVRSHARLAES